MPNWVYNSLTIEGNPGTIFGGQKSGDYQCLRCGFTWDQHNPPRFSI
jgi:hypothetical protein